MKKLVQAILDRSRGLRGFRQDYVLLRDRDLRRPQREMVRYLAETAEPALHLGANQQTFPGWLNTDIEPANRSTIYLDASKPFPLPDASVEFVYAEHMIEHIERAAGLAMLRECRRVLKRGGVLRLTTPDLGFLLELYCSPTDASRAYLDWVSHRFLSPPQRPSAALVINNAFRAWGHQFLYDAETLEEALRSSGFSQVERVGYNESAHKRLRDIEHHGINVGNEEMAKLETMIFEAS